MKRSIIRIDEEKCNGCGLCIPSCAEGALQIVNGKARLVADKLCDGLGACLGNCPQNALIIEERDADAFDEEAVHEHLKESAEPTLACGCPGTMSRTTAPKAGGSAPCGEVPSALGQWPVQLKLINPAAPFLHKADLLLAADCVPFAYAGFHQNILAGRALAVGCPKLDNAAAYVEKLAEIIRHNHLKSISIAYMEVPCCGALLRVVHEALKQAGCKVPVEAVKFSLDGQIIERKILS